jgi:hypothetical protein
MQQVASKCIAVPVYFKQFCSNSFRVSFLLFNVPTNEVLISSKIKTLPRTRHAFLP